MIVALQGGLGNQMFQYAFGVSVAKARGEKVYFSRNRVDADPKREYSLGAFNLPIEFAEEKEPFYYDTYLYDPGVYTAPKDSTFVGHWQTEKYFDEGVREIFRPPPGKFLDCPDNFLRGNKTSIHVRRADYLLPEAVAYHGLCSTAYYERAVRRVYEIYGQGMEFFVFSDDPEWCKTVFRKEAIVPRFTIMPIGTPHDDLWLMSLCPNAIIANSSFSWWGAWLGLQSLVIAPKRWYANGPLERDICPDRWLRLEN